MARSHKDVNFEVTSPNRSNTSYKTFAEAASSALMAAASSGSATLDIIVWSAAGARWLGGDDAVERYREDPEASVFERYQIKVNAQGRVS